MSDTQTSTTSTPDTATDRRVVETMLPGEPGSQQPSKRSSKRTKVDHNAQAKKASADVEQQLNNLDQMMADVLATTPEPDITSRCVVESPSEPDVRHLQRETPLPRSVKAPPRPHRLLRLFPSVGRRFDAAYETARSLNAHEMNVWNEREKARRDAIERRWAAYRSEVIHSEQKVRAELAVLALQATNGEPEAIERYAKTVVTDASYPDGFDLQPIFRFDEATRVVSGELTLPVIDDVVPKLRHHRYIRERHSILSAEIPDDERHLAYRNALAAAVLRVAYEIFESDLSRKILGVSLNGEVNTFDGATGHETRVTVVSLATTRANLLDLNLARVVPTETLRWLGGRLSTEPHLLAPVLRVS